MKVVIDTNIVVSAVIRDRLPERVLLWCRWIDIIDVSRLMCLVSTISVST